MKHQRTPVPVTWAILYVCTIGYAAGNPLALALWPVGGQHFQPWQIVTYAFLHGSPLHLAGNMLALLTFGPMLERDWGRWRFLACYLLAAVIGGVLQALVAPAPTVGASGALFGLFAAWTIANPRERIFTLFPWPLPAYVVLLAYLVFSVAAALAHWLPNIAHVAHIGGAITGAWFATSRVGIRTR